jgi:hypothetical protein
MLTLFKRAAKPAYYQRPAFLTGKQQRIADDQRLKILAGYADTDPLWQTILSYVDEHHKNEIENSLSPKLSDSERQYAAGRAASAYDLAMALRDLKSKAKEIRGR